MSCCVNFVDIMVWSWRMELHLERKPYQRRFSIWKSTLYKVSILLSIFVKNLDIVFARET